MPTRFQIESNLARLPAIQLGHMPNDKEIWEANEYGGHFKVTKDSIDMPPRRIPLTVCSLSISGSSVAKANIVRDFKAVLGEPVDTATLRGDIALSMFVLPAEATSTVHQVLGKDYNLFCEEASLTMAEKGVLDRVFLRWDETGLGQEEKLEIFLEELTIGSRQDPKLRREVLLTAFVKINMEYADRSPLNPLGRRARKARKN